MRIAATVSLAGAKHDPQRKTSKVGYVPRSHVSRTRVATGTPQGRALR